MPPTGPSRPHPHQNYMPLIPPTPLTINVPPLPLKPASPEEILERWKQTLSSGPGTRLGMTTTIPEVTMQLKMLLNSLSALKELHSKLSTTQVDGSRKLWTEVAEHKDVIERVGKELNKRDKLILQRKVRHGRKKREMRKVERENERERVAAKEEACSEWLKRKQSELMRKKLEESVEKEAEGSLGEVRKKKQDLENVTKLLEALKELREHRISSKKWKVDGPHIEADQKFSELCSKIESIVSIHQKVYEEEEYTLKVMMSEQVDAKMTAQTSDHTHNSDNNLDSDPLKAFYYQAEQDMASFLNVRQQWDQYLSPLGSGVPEGWVEPVLPSDSTWASCLVQDKTGS